MLEGTVIQNKITGWDCFDGYGLFVYDVPYVKTYVERKVMSQENKTNTKNNYDVEPNINGIKIKYCC